MLHCLGLAVGAGHVVEITTAEGLLLAGVIDNGDATYAQEIETDMVGTALITATVQGLPLEASASLNITPPMDGVLGRDAAGNSFTFATIQAAVDAVGANGLVEILVPPGFYDEIVLLDDVSGLVIEGFPPAVVEGFRLMKCEDVAILNFDIEAGATREHRIHLLGGNKKNVDIVIEGNRISGADVRHSGVVAGRGNTLTLRGNHIFDNGRNGVQFTEVIGGPHLLEGNLIEANGGNGVRVGRNHVVWLVENEIRGNGLAPGRSGGRYGVLRDRSGGRPDPTTVTLRDNVITSNNGRIQAGRSSIDLGNHDQFLNAAPPPAADAGNVTTTGSEGPGVMPPP